MSFKSISSITLGQGFTYHKPQVPRYTKISVNDAAIDVMTDLKNVAAITISGHESIDNANEKMKIKKVLKSFFFCLSFFFFIILFLVQL